MFLFWVCRVTSVILSHFILDLRQDENEHFASTTTQSTLEFAQRVEDSLGGSLNNIWGSGIDESSDECENTYR